MQGQDRLRRKWLQEQATLQETSRILITFQDVGQLKRNTRSQRCRPQSRYPYATSYSQFGVWGGRPNSFHDGASPSPSIHHRRLWRRTREPRSLRRVGRLLCGRISGASSGRGFQQCLGILVSILLPYALRGNWKRSPRFTGTGINSAMQELRMRNASTRPIRLPLRSGRSVKPPARFR